MTRVPDLAAVVRELDTAYPPEFAEQWDAVGLVAGEGSAPVRRILFAVDPVDAVVREAIDWRADLLVTHHPLFLRAVHSVAASTFKGSAVHRLIRAGCGLYVAHTNADAAAGGVAAALAAALGLVDVEPLVPLPAPAAPGTGTGRLGRPAEPCTLGEFARRVAGSLPATAQGVRVAGDLDAPVRTVAVVGGSGDTFFDAARASGADVYVTADLRHHPASEQRERAGLDAGLGAPAATPYLVDVAHFASEWPWLPVAAAHLRSRLGDGVEIRVSTQVTDPWTARFGSSA